MVTCRCANPMAIAIIWSNNHNNPSIFPWYYSDCDCTTPINIKSSPILYWTSYLIWNWQNKTNATSIIQPRSKNLAEKVSLMFISKLTMLHIYWRWRWLGMCTQPEWTLEKRSIFVTLRWCLYIHCAKGVFY